MNALSELINNKLLICGVSAWLTAQVIKAVLYALVNKEIRISRLFGDGGMPSGHSATVSAMACSAGILYGLGSFQFAMTVMLAIIVMHDAMGVRQETGKQAKVIKEIAFFMEMMGNDISDEEKLKEFVGHNFFQVIVGMLLGVTVAFFICFVY